MKGCLSKSNFSLLVYLLTYELKNAFNHHRRPVGQKSGKFKYINKNPESPVSGNPEFSYCIILC